LKTSSIRRFLPARKSKTGILVLGHRRPALLANTLESLRRQKALGMTHVWLDGHYGQVELIEPVRACRKAAERLPVAEVVAHNGRVGTAKLMLNALRSMTGRYERLIVLEDDCFPTSSAVAEFGKALDEIAIRDEIYSVYGHHFRLPTEGATFSRFQGWGWATTRTKLLPILDVLEACFWLPEREYLLWVQETVTPEVRSRLEVTPGRQPLESARLFFSWDECTAIVTAARGLLHKKTAKQVVFNCGIGPSSGHFEAEEPRFREPPFGMIGPDEVWGVYPT